MKAAPGRLIRVLVLHGPNLNLLGRREPALYGATTLAEIDAGLAAAARARGAEVAAFQSNHEGALIDEIHARLDWADGCIANPGGLTHTSVALRDALLALDRPFFEVHLTDITAREPFRRVSLLSDVAAGVVSGLGAEGYGVALERLLDRLGAPPRPGQAPARKEA